MGRLLDRDIRPVLLRYIRSLPNFEEGDCLIEEKSLANDTRVDVLHVKESGYLHGYEIKSDGDSWGKRWLRQRAAYPAVLPYNTVVTTGEMYKSFPYANWRNREARAWGTIVVQNNQISYRANPPKSRCLCPHTILETLHKKEVAELSILHGIPVSRRAPKRDLVQAAAMYVPLHDILVKLAQSLITRYS